MNGNSAYAAPGEQILTRPVPPWKLGVSGEAMIGDA